VAYPTRDLADIKRIVLHHTGGTDPISVERLAAYSVENGRAGIIYHYCVTDQGTVYQTQPLEAIPFPDDTFNQDSINICLIGNFSETPPPPAQLNTTAVLIANLLDEFGFTAAQVYGQSDLVATQSPGSFWPAWRDALRTELENLSTTGITVTVATPVPTPTPPPVPTLEGGN
jgi:N-acetyl-anhydromuramyl-L-alanine amidase AmpD